MSTTIKTFQARFQEITQAQPDTVWFNQEQTAYLIGETVEDVIRYCSRGSLESVWEDLHSDARVWLVFEIELHRWLRFGPRETMDYATAMTKLADRQGAFRRAVWNNLEHLEAFHPGIDVDEGYVTEEDVEKLGLKDLDPARYGYTDIEDDVFDGAYLHSFLGKYEPTAEDKTATDWVEHHIDFYRAYRACKRDLSDEHDAGQ